MECIGKVKGDVGFGNIFIGYSGAGWQFRSLINEEISSSDYKFTCLAFKLLNPTKKCRTTLMSQADAEKITETQQKTKPFFKAFEDESILTSSNRALELNPKVLAFDMPSLSFAAGGTRIEEEDILEDAYKVNMNTAFKKNNFPTGRVNENWYHSDFKDVAYLYTSEFFNDMVLRAKLK